MKLFKSTKNAIRYGAQAAAHPHIYPIRTVDEMVAAFQDAAEHADDKIVPFTMDVEPAAPIFEVDDDTPASFADLIRGYIDDATKAVANIADAAYEMASQKLIEVLDPIVAGETFGGPIPTVTFSDVDTSAADAAVSAQL